MLCYKLKCTTATVQNMSQSNIKTRGPQMLLILLHSILSNARWTSSGSMQPHQSIVIRPSVFLLVLRDINHLQLFLASTSSVVTFILQKCPNSCNFLYCNSAYYHATQNILHRSNILTYHITMATTSKFLYQKCFTNNLTLTLANMTNAHIDNIRCSNVYMLKQHHTINISYTKG